MSLTTDEIFWNALKHDAVIVKTTGARIYSAAITVPPSEQDNVSVPYIVTSFDGGSNEQQTKDDYESDTDTVDVSIEVTAKTREELGELMGQVRQAVRNYFRGATEDSEDYDLIPDDYQLSFSAVSWDWEKPCFWQTLIYQCSTKNDTL